MRLVAFQKLFVPKHVAPCVAMRMATIASNHSQRRRQVMTNGDDSRNPTFKLRENFTGTVENLNTYLSVSRYSYKSYMQEVFLHPTNGSFVLIVRIVRNGIIVTLIAATLWRSFEISQILDIHRMITNRRRSGCGFRSSTADQILYDAHQRDE